MPASSSESSRDKLRAGEADPERLERNLGYAFRAKGLLSEALTHRSFAHERRQGKIPHNERLEFLGDSVVGLVIVEHLFRLGAGHTESMLAKVKSYLVSEPVLAELGAAISLGDHLLLGKGEDATGGRGKRSILADALEALIGAVFLDAGYETARTVVLRLFGDRIGRAVSGGRFSDFKTELQEKSQVIFGALPEYRLIRESGEEHSRVFTVAVYLIGKRIATASGRRKKEAEALAAEKALDKLS